MDTLSLCTGTGSDLVSAKGSWNSRSRRPHKKQRTAKRNKPQKTQLRHRHRLQLHHRRPCQRHLLQHLLRLVFLDLRAWASRPWEMDQQRLQCLLLRNRHRGSLVTGSLANNNCQPAKQSGKENTKQQKKSLRTNHQHCHTPTTSSQQPTTMLTSRFSKYQHNGA